jgi:hypothetical protein
MEEKMSTTEEARTCPCGRPVSTALTQGGRLDDEGRYCAEHKRAVAADDTYGEWLEAHETMRKGLGEAIDDPDDSPQNEMARNAMERIKRECARWAGELEIAGWMAEEREGFFVGERRLSPEEAEEGGRLLKRADRLEDAIEAVYKAPGLDESELWAILAVLYEAHDQASEEISRFRGESPA